MPMLTLIDHINNHIPRWIGNVVIVGLLVGYMVIAWHSLNTAQPTGEPGQGTNEYITNPIIHPGDGLDVHVNSRIDQSSCRVIVQRHIVFAASGEEIYAVWSQIPTDDLIKFNKGATIKVPLPKLKPGFYLYISDIHLYCKADNTSYSRTSDYISFQVVPSSQFIP